LGDQPNLSNLSKISQLNLKVVVIVLVAAVALAAVAVAAGYSTKYQCHQNSFSHVMIFLNCLTMATNVCWWTLVVFLIISDYLLSNNHINSIIVHKFDFSDEEVCHCCFLLQIPCLWHVTSSSSPHFSWNCTFV